MMSAATDIGKDRQQQQQSTSRAVVKAVTAAAAAGSMLVLSGLTLAATVVGLTMATLLLVIFSLVLVPAAVAAFLISAGFLASGGFGLAALSVLLWTYTYLTGKCQPGADQLNRARHRLASKTREAKDSAQHRIDQDPQ